MRRLGEPQRKIPKLEQQPSDEHQPTKADRTGRDPQTSEGEKKGLTDGPRREHGAQKRLRKAENREKREQKAKARKERDEGKKEEGEGRKAEEKGREADKKPTEDIRLV